MRVNNPKVYKRVCELAEHDLASWQPAPLLKRLAEAGRTFNQGWGPPPPIAVYQKKVIIGVWEFREYQSVEGKRPVSEWYEALSQKNRASADRFLGIVQKLEQLKPPRFEKFRELLEARWFGQNRVPHRIFCDKPSDGQVTFLCGCTHKDRRYTPTNACNTALRRRDEIQNGEAGTHEFDF